MGILVLETNLSKGLVLVGHIGNAADATDDTDLFAANLLRSGLF